MQKSDVTYILCYKMILAPLFNKLQNFENETVGVFYPTVCIVDALFIVFDLK